LCTEFHFPSTSGRSRHGAPVRLIQNTPSNTLRWFLEGRPPCGEGCVRKGSKIDHSSSLIRPRITANLQQRGQRRITHAPRRGSARRQTAR
jgi:hypothetical protein